MSDKPSPSVAERLRELHAIAGRSEIDRQTFATAAIEQFPTLLAELDRLTALVKEAETKLDRYRYATDWTAADSWDFCSDCRERLAWARMRDGERRDVNQIAEIGRAFLSRLEGK